MTLSKDAAAQQGIIDVVMNYLNGLLKQPQNQTLDTPGMISVSSKLHTFLEQYQGKVSGEFASRFRRIYQRTGDVPQAEAEINLAEDLMQGNTILRSGKVEGVLEVPSRANPEFLFRGDDGTIRAIEVKTLTTPSLDGVSRNLSEAAAQIEALSGSASQRGFIRINSGANPPSWSTAELQLAVENWLKDPQRNKNGVVEFVEVSYYDNAGVLGKLVLP